MTCTANWKMAVSCRGCDRHGPTGYAKCGICGMEVPEISKETPKENARCRIHGTWSSQGRCAAEPREPKPEPKEGEPKKTGKPIRFIQNLLSDKPITVEEIKAALAKEGYSPGTAGGQLYQLRNWDGCRVTQEGFVKA